METIRQLEQLDASTFATKADRIAATNAARAFLARTDSPYDHLRHMTLNQPQLIAVLTTFRDLQLFEKWDKSGKKEQTAAELAELVGADPVLIARMMRHLGGNFLVHEVAPGKYEQSSFTKSVGELSLWFDLCSGLLNPAFAQIPFHLKSTGYKNPHDLYDGCFQTTFDCAGVSMFQWLEKRPVMGAAFNGMMATYNDFRAPWVDIYPVADLDKDADPSKPLLIDIGGNTGRDLDQFIAKTGISGERLVLQDRPEVIAVATCNEGIKREAYDFFTPEPVFGARAYYMHSILHDYNDGEAMKILQNIRPALKAGYSTLLINDNVVPDYKASAVMTAVDMTMLAVLSGTERTETMWHELLTAAGYKIKKIHTLLPADSSVIEAELA